MNQQSNSPAFYSQPINSNNPPSILQPQSANSIQQPHSVNSIQQPHSVNSIQQPHSVSNIQQPHSVSNIQQPHSVSNLQQPHSVSNLQQPHSVSSLHAAQSSAPIGPNHTVNLDFSNAVPSYSQSDLNGLVSTFQYEFSQDETPEPITKSKELFTQLKFSIQVVLKQILLLNEYQINSYYLFRVF